MSGMSTGADAEALQRWHAETSRDLRAGGLQNVFSRCLARHRLPEGFAAFLHNSNLRQTGLSGSSAIICAAFNCLCFSGAGGNLSFQHLTGAHFAVGCGGAGTTAGLMDRV
jgi:hypothetical protein